MTLPAERWDQLYRLVPAIHRARDEKAGFPLRDLLRVISEQVGHVEDDLDGLYDNWFIETAADWAVPYLGDLVGYRPVSAAGELAQAAPEQVRALIPRREVADSVRAHRRKGTLALLEELAADVAGWPAKAVEFYRLLAVFQNLNHMHPDRGAVADLRQVERLDQLGGPFDSLARSVDVRRINSARGQGFHNIPEVGVFVWRLRAYPVTAAPAACIEEVGPSCFTFSVLGNDAPLFTRPDPEAGGELGLPTPIRRHMLHRRFRDYYGPGRSFSVEVGERVGGKVRRVPVPAEKFIVADLTDWAYRTPKDQVAIDPELGRLAFPPGHPPHGVWVCYHYGFSSDIGGGEYPRRLAVPAPGTFYQAVAKQVGPGMVTSIEDALDAWDKVRDEQPVAVIEIRDNEVYVEQLTIELRRGESLTLRAADRTRPVIYLLDKQRNAPDALTVFTEQGENCRPGGCFTLDGVTVAGRPVHVEGPLQRVQIRDCTLVPGWGLTGDCRPRRPAEPSLEIYLCDGRISVERSIIGSIQVYADEVTADPTRIEISDSIVDATDREREAVGAPNWPLAHAAVSFTDSTVIGTVGVHAIPLAQNTLFLGCVRVARRQIGCVRYSYVPPGSRTPRRHRCQPDMVDAAVRGDEQTELLAAERDRVRPRFTDLRYGTPGYAQLRTDCAPEIGRGADDESEMGVFHDLYQPQRLANLVARLEQFTPAHTDVAVLIAN
ncbi:hypothetical protein DFR70_1094 [Nocardia tenerifensis]|uniref:Tail protein P2 I n=1 Tax=Nocardia tenerifensis TaxID=228006 RepID=A0A318K8R9_9NOCA|nr:hypothetical protein [Nocardia tenerifensis]PXX60813.1 hypothetical protein DFR70_1094 [Nocardia tenerifensis]